MEWKNLFIYAKDKRAEDELKREKINKQLFSIGLLNREWRSFRDHAS